EGGHRSCEQYQSRIERLFVYARCESNLSPGRGAGSGNNWSQRRSAHNVSKSVRRNETKRLGPRARVRGHRIVSRNEAHLHRPGVAYFKSADNFSPSDAASLMGDFPEACFAGPSRNETARIEIVSLMISA